MITALVYILPVLFSMHEYTCFYIAEKSLRVMLQ